MYDMTACIIFKGGAPPFVLIYLSEWVLETIVYEWRRGLVVDLIQCTILC